MTKKEFKNVGRGAIIRHKGSKRSYVVDVILGTETRELVLVSTRLATNPSEWDLVRK